MRFIISLLAICAQKVRVALAEKNLQWESRITLSELRSPEYLRLNPNGYVPTLVHDDKVIIELRIINEYIDHAFPEPALLSADPFDRARVGLWTKQIDDSLHLNVYVLTFAASFRQRYLEMSAEQLEKSLPLANPVKRQYTLDLIKHGFESPILPSPWRAFKNCSPIWMRRWRNRPGWSATPTASLTLILLPICGGSMILGCGSWPVQRTPAWHAGSPRCRRGPATTQRYSTG